MTTTGSFCPRCVMWVVFDPSHGQADCDGSREENNGPLLAHWVEVIHPTWFLA